jgi:hypothetical protein
MKKSDKYNLAILAVIDSARMNAETKLEIIETLMADKSLSEWCEKEDKNNAESV